MIIQIKRFCSPSTKYSFEQVLLPYIIWNQEYGTYLSTKELI
jgi:hypothetical protein